MPKTAKVRQPDNSPYIIIAGGAGFLGSHLTESLLLSGARVIGLDSLITGNLANIAPFKRHPRYEFIECNINQGLPQSLQDKPITHVVQTIGLETHALDQQLTLSSMLTGAFATKNLLDLAVAKGATFLLTSSISVYQGLASSTSLNYYYGSDPEQRATFSMYEAKRYAEGLVEMYAQQYNLDARVARLSQLYGPRMDILDGSFLDQLLQQVLAGQDLLVKEEGSRELYLTYVSDAVYGLSRLLFAQGSHYRQTIYPIVNQEKISVLSVAYTLRNYLPAGKDVQFATAQTSNISNLPVISMDRTKRDLDWEATTSLTQGLKQTVEYFQQNKPALNRHEVPTEDKLSTTPALAPAKQSPPPVSKPASPNPSAPANNTPLTSKPPLNNPTPTNAVSTTSSIPNIPPVLAYRNGSDPDKLPAKLPLSSSSPDNETVKKNKVPSKRSNKSWWRRLFALGLIAALYFAWGQPLVHTTLAGAYATYHIKQGIAESKQLHFNQAQQSFDQARQAFTTAGQQWQRLSYLTQLINLDNTYQQVDQTLQASIAASEGLSILTKTAQPWPHQLQKMIPANLSQTADFPTEPNDQAIIHLSQQTQQNLQRVHRQFGRALLALSQPQSSTQVAGAAINLADSNPQETVGQTGILAGFQQYLRTNIAQVQLVIDQADQLISVLPDVLGSAQDKRYLIMLQNSNELRPTGGFTGSYIAITFSHGQLASFVVDDIYNPDGQIKEKVNPHATIPAKEATHDIPLRDANWYPDVPTSAQLIIQRYKQATGLSVDGVGFVTVQAVKPLLRQLGSLYLPYVDKTVDADNFDTLAQTYSDVNYVAGSTNKKDFLGQLTQALINKITTDKSASWSQVGQAIAQGLHQREIQLYAIDPTLTLLINQRDWGGLTSNTDQDYLRVIDANIASNKANYYVSRSTKYDVNVNRLGDLSAVVTVTWDHQGQSATWPGGDFVNYLRVYAPQGASLYGSKGFDQGTDIKKYIENGKQVFAGQVTIPYGQKTSIELRYHLPLSLTVADNQLDYQLTWQKQSGIINEPVIVQFNMPSYLKFANSSLTPRTYNQMVQWQVTGLTDTNISASFVNNY